MLLRCKLLLFLLVCLCLSPLRGQPADKEPKVFFQREKQLFILYASNSALYPISLQFDFDLKGLKPIDDQETIFVIPAQKDSLPLFTFVIPEGRSWSYKYTYSYSIGDVNTQHDADHVYLLPFQEDEYYLLSQGYFGKSSHQNEHALDFTMPKGTRIMAARKGLVVDVKEDSNKGCPRKSCNDYGNYIRILHADGSIADYYHLQQDGVLVDLGQQVEAGELIGLAGATGWASRSHLHFIVYQAGINGRESFPTLFKTRDHPEGTLLKEGNTYLSVR